MILSSVSPEVKRSQEPARLNELGPKQGHQVFSIVSKELMIIHLLACMQDGNGCCAGNVCEVVFFFFFLIVHLELMHGI